MSQHKGTKSIKIKWLFFILFVWRKHWNKPYRKRGLKVRLL